MELDISDDKNLVFLIDTGSDVSLIKRDKLKANVKINEKKTNIKGLVNSCITLGNVEASFGIKDELFTHHFHIIREDVNFKSDGILGIDFIRKFGVKIDCEKEEINIKEKKIKFYNKDNIVVPARSEIIINAISNYPDNFVGVSDKLEIETDIFIGSSLTNVKNKRSIVSIINVSEEEKTIKRPFVQLDKYCNFTDNYRDNDTANGERIDKILNLINKDHLNSFEKDFVHNICSSYSDIFHLEGESLSCTNAVKHKIVLKKDTAPIHKKPYRLPQIHKDVIKEESRRMLKEGIIRNSNSEWNSPLLVVPKHDNEGLIKKWRVVTDFRKINEVTVGDAFPLPNITEILDQLGNSKYFSKLDLSQGFYQIPIDEESKKLTAFSTGTQHYEYNRMVMGMKTAPATFQRLMNSVLMGLQGLKCFVYLDDIVIYGRSFEEHNNRLLEVFDRIRNANLKLKPEKCEILRKEVIYLGHIISSEGIKPDPRKIKDVKHFPTPKTVKNIKSFLGLAGYYRKFIEDFSKIAVPLSKLLRKDSKFLWTDLTDKAFQTLKEKLITPPILQYPNFEKPFILTTDSSSFAIGAVLSQNYTGNDLPIAYASRILNSAETRYSTTEREMLAIVWAVNHFRPYLYGTKFTIITDHKPLTFLKRMQDPGSRLLNMRLKLEIYDFEIKYKIGRNNTNADALSRSIPSSDPVVNIIDYTDNYGDYLNFISKNIIINEDIIDTNSTIENNINLHQSFLFTLTSDLANTNDFFETINNKFKILDEIQIKVTEESKCFHINQNGKIFVCAIVKETLRNKIKLRDIFDILCKIKEKCVELDIKDMCLSKFGLTEGHNWSKIRVMLRYIFKDTGIKVTIYHSKYNLNNEQKIKLIKEFHDTPLGGHQGLHRTYKKMKKYVSWKNMKRSIEDYIKKCISCQKNKMNQRKTKMPLEITSTARNPFEKCFLDIVGPLNITDDRNKYILTFIDDISKFVVASPIPNQEVETISKTFVKNIICKHGIPSEIVTDQGANFMSDIFKNVCKLLRIKKINTTAFHPESNGSLERSHLGLVEYLRHFINPDQSDWDNWLPFYAFTYNTTPHSATGLTPFEILYGHKASLPSTILAKPEPTYAYDDYVSDLRQKLRFCRDMAHKNLINAKEKSKENYDKKVNVRIFSVGDKILLYDESVRRGKSKKLGQKWIGPYIIIEKCSDVNFIIKKGKKPYKVHANRIKPFYD